MDYAVEIKQLTKVFKGKKAVDDVSFSIKRGEIVAILGPNGAGKSTAMLMMLGLLHPTNGESKLFDADAKEKKGCMEVRRLLIYQLHTRNIRALDLALLAQVLF